MSSLREKVLNAQDVRRENVTVPEWDGAEFEVRGLGMRTYNQLCASCNDAAGELVADRFYPALIIATTHDPESGGKVFTEGDRDMLADKSGKALTRIVDVALRLCGADAGEVEKNSEPTPSGGTSSE